MHKISALIHPLNKLRLCPPSLSLSPFFVSRGDNDAMGRKLSAIKQIHITYVHIHVLSMCVCVFVCGHIRNWTENKLS